MTIDGRYRDRDIDRLTRNRDAALARAEKAEKCCAEIRDVLRDCEGLKVGHFQCKVCQGYRQGDVMIHAPHCRLAHALSSDCGQDYIHKRELLPTKGSK